MRTKKRLIELANNNEFTIYKKIAITLSKKLFINKWSIKSINNSLDKQYNLCSDIIRDMDIDEFIYVHRKEIRMIVKIWFWNFKRFDIRFEESQVAMVEYVILFHFKKIANSFED